MKAVKGAVGGIIFLVILSLMTGTTFWVATDIFALYTENQFTGRMRAFDVEYWDAVYGSGFVFLASWTIKTFIAAVRQVADAGQDEESE